MPSNLNTVFIFSFYLSSLNFTLFGHSTLPTFYIKIEFLISKWDKFTQIDGP